MTDKKDYEVGYGKPPKHTQFQPGHSGNPRRCPQGRKNDKAVLRNVLNEKIAISINGKPKKMSQLEAYYRSQFARALKGEASASRTCAQILDKAGYMDPVPPEGKYGVMRIPTPVENAEEWSAMAQKHQKEAAARAREIHAGLEKEDATAKPAENDTGTTGQKPRKVRIVKKRSAE